MPQQKRKASTIASAKIAEDAGSGRKRKSDAKEEHPIKENDKSKGDEVEQGVSDDKKVKKSADESSDNKRRKKQPHAEQQYDNNANGNEPQGHDLINPDEHDQMLIDEYDKDVKSHKEVEQHNGQDDKKVNKETIKELGKS